MSFFRRMLFYFKQFPLTFSFTIPFLLPLPAHSFTNEEPLLISGQTKVQQYYFNPAQELRLLKKVLTFERNWKERAGKQLIIGLLYQKSNPVSHLLMEDWLNLFSELSAAEKTIDDIPIVFKAIDFDSVSSLEKALVEEQIQLLYLTPLEIKKSSGQMKDIFRLCQKLKIGTFSGVAEYLDAGVAMVFELKENKQQIFINLEACKAQGLNFSSQFLRLVKIRNING